MDEPSQKQYQMILYKILQNWCADGRTLPKIAAAANKPPFQYNRYCTYYHHTAHSWQQQMFSVLYRKILNWREIEQSPLYVWSSEGLLKCVSLHQLMLQSIELLSTMIEAAGMIISNANLHSWKQDGWPLQVLPSIMMKFYVRKTTNQKPKETR